MNTETSGVSAFVLHGLDGDNPLAFLAALGTLRTLARSIPGQPVRMSWSPVGAWRPVLHVETELQQDELVCLLHGQLAGTDEQIQFTTLGNDLSVTPDIFRSFTLQAAESASSTDRVAADFAAAFGCEITATESAGKSTIQDTALRTMAGAGHQHFLGFMRNIIRETNAEHLVKALFASWRYDDPVQNLTLRWDPIDDVRYALRWRNPSGDPNRRSAGSVLGANRLAIEGLPLLPTVPQGTRLATTGFRGQRSSDTYWTWPIWEYPVTLNVVRSLLAMRTLQDEKPNRDVLGRYGIREVFRSQRLTIGKVRNFTPGQSV